eukprot:jgi/Tetstr1/438831/TSEL_027340.t1
MNLSADLFSLCDPRAHKYAKPLPKAASWKMADELVVVVLSSSPAGSAGLAGDGAALPNPDVAFADDVLIFSHDDEQEHMRRVRIVFDRLKARGVQVSPPKTRLGLSRVTFLGHIVSGAGVEPMADKVEAINSLPAPKNVSDVRHFLGMATYYCRFLESFSLVKAPLTALIA